MPLRDELPKINLPLRMIKTPPRDMINLMSSELIHPDIDSILKNIKDWEPEIVQFYPCIDPWMRRIAALMHVPDSSLTISAGSDLMISILIDAFSLYTKNIILQTPSYSSWRNFAVLRQMNIKLMPFSQVNEYGFHLLDLIREIKDVTSSVVVIINPHSPTGFCFSEDEMCQLALECKKNDNFLLVDECYISFSKVNHRKLLDISDRVVLIRSFSKSFGLAGARVAVTLASEDIIGYLSHWRPEFTVSGFSLKVLEYMLLNKTKIDAICDDIIYTKERFVAELNYIKPNWCVFPSSTNFILIKIGDTDEPNLIVEHLKAYKFRIGSVSFAPELKGCIRMTIAHWGIMQDVLEIIKNM